MDEVVHLKLSKEEYPTPAPKNVPKDIELVEKRDKKQSNDNHESKIFCVNFKHFTNSRQTSSRLCYAN